MRTICTLLTLMVTIVTNHAQQIEITNQTLFWKVVSVKTKTNDESITRNSEVIVYGDKKIEWVQPEASRKYTFEILGIKGNWVDATIDGVLEYEAKLGDSQGTITFQRDGDMITIDFDLKKGEKTTFPFTLSIDSISKK